MEDCLFCKIVENKVPNWKVAESTNLVAFLNVYPSAKGHVLIVPKKHSTNFLDFPEYLGTEFLEFSQRVATAVVAAAHADGFNLALNNGMAAGQVIFHTHFHIVPRVKDDGMHGPFGRELKLAEEELADLQKRMQAALQ
jgi:histidine triad (HIT) family protein